MNSQLSIPAERAPLAHAVPPLSTSFGIPSLDGWRAVAILIVFLGHTGLGNILPGGFGVTIFFFLSGYLITSLMIIERRRSGTVSISKFYLRRFLRLAPPLLTTLVIVYSLTYFKVLTGGVSWRGLGAQILYLANYYQLFLDPGRTTPDGTGVFWSLAVEEHFYMVFPWLFVLLSRYGIRRFATVMALICILTLLWRFYLVYAFHVSEDRIYYASDTRIDSIIFGSLLALLRNPLDEVKSVSRFTQWGLLVLSVLLILFSLLYRAPFFRETSRYTIQGIALAPFFYYSIRLPRSPTFRLLNTSVMRYIGKNSYAIYLIHFVLIENFARLTSSTTVNMTLCFLLAVLYAYFIDKIVDRHFRVVRARLR